MNDVVNAVYRKMCYAGYTTLLLETVFYCESIPEKYKSCDYVIKCCELKELYTIKNFD